MQRFDLVGRWFLVATAIGGCLAADKPVDFNRDIRPVLSDNCFTCHGPDDKHRMANLRLDTEEGLFATARLRIITPGDLAKSRLLRPHQRRTATDAAAAGRHHAHRRADRHCTQVDRTGRQVGAALVVRAAGAARPAGGPQ